MIRWSRAFVVALPLLLLSRCSAPEHRVVLVFPDQQLMEATSRVLLAVHEAPDGEDPCAKLALGEDAGTKAVLQKTTGFPFSGESIGVGKLEDGRYAFAATAHNQSDQRFLSGCTLAEVSVDGDPVTVRVVLAELRGAGCSPGTGTPCYDGASATEGVGICKGGVATCENGYFTTCVGQQLPLQEQCNGQDDDCDGAVDNGCTATDGGSPDLSPPADAGGDLPVTDTGGDQTVTCSAGAFECRSDGTARSCVNGTWSSLGSCPLGCDAAAKQCLIPSNVDADTVGKGTGDLDLTAGGTPVTIDTDTGEIKGSSGTIRAAGTGLDAASGIYFALVVQGSSQPGLGVFSAKKLLVPEGTVLRASGGRALVVVLTDAATIDGVIDATGAVKTPGPGGYAGGDADAPGLGPGGGQTSQGINTGDYCAGGGGGGGHAGPGGEGAKSQCAAPDDFAGGLGGVTSGVAALVPLAGGSGGAGGTVATGGTSTPGSGGGGGGAVQIVSAMAISVGSKGGINVGGGGGGETISGGGSGGGSGGAILLEAPAVTVATGAVLAANGGGGGGGDCT